MPDQETLVKQLSTALVERAPKVQLFIEYYRGLHRIRFATEKWEDTFAGLFDELADNWSQIVVDAAVDDPFMPDGDALWSRILARQGGTLARLSNFPPHPSVN